MEYQPTDKKEWLLKVITGLLILPLVFLVNNLWAFAFGTLTGIKGGLTFFAIVSFSQACLLIGFTLYLTLVRWKMTLQDLGLGLEGWPRGFWHGLINGPVVFLLVVLVGTIVEQMYPFEGEIQPFTKMVLQADSLFTMAILCLLGIVVAPVAEELYFRGLLFPLLKSHVGLVGGIVFSGLIFGFLHFDLFRFVPLALGGMALAWLYQQAGSLYASITAHGVWNALMLIILYLSQS